MENHHQEPKPVVYLLLIVTIIVWGLSWPVSKLGLQFMSPLYFVLVRLSIGTVTMFIVVAFLGKLIWPRREDWPIIFSIGIFQVGLFMGFINIGLHYIEAGRSAILVYTTPIWVTPISILFFGEDAGLLKWLGLFCGVIGILILFGPWGINWQDHGAIFGNTVLLLGAISWATAMLCARHMRWTRPPLELIPWQLLVAFIPIIFLMFFYHEPMKTQWNNTLILSLLYNGFFSTAVAYWSTVIVSKELPPITASLGLLGVPVVGIILSAIMVHESITWVTVLAMIFILTGLVCVIFESYLRRARRVY